MRQYNVGYYIRLSNGYLKLITHNHAKFLFIHGMFNLNSINSQVTLTDTDYEKLREKELNYEI